MATATNQTATESNAGTGPDLTTNVVVTQDLSTSGAVTVAAGQAARGADETPPGGTVGENLVWEGRYSVRNFLVRTIAAVLLTVICALLAFDVWGLGRAGYQFLAILAGIAAVTFWAYLGIKAIRASHSHHYRLTTRRLFVSSGWFRRRVDQIELVRIKDLYLKQTMMNHWLNVGTVVVVSAEPTLPKAALLGISQPQLVLDLIWQNVRREQDRCAVIADAFRFLRRRWRLSSLSPLRVSSVPTV